MVGYQFDCEVLIVLRAYLDDSGSNDSAVLAIGGGISSPDKWVAFEHRLRPFLTTHNLQTLHMSELKWGGENDDGPIVQGAFSLVDQYVECYVGCSVRTANPGLKRYHEAGLACVGEVINLVEERWPDEQVEIVFEQTKGLTGTVVATIKDAIKYTFGQHAWNRVSDIRTETKHTLALGAADLIAYTYRVMAETGGQHMQSLPRLKQWAVQQLQKKSCRRFYSASGVEDLSNYHGMCDEPAP
jgi:hypothetical protein